MRVLCIFTAVWQLLVLLCVLQTTLINGDDDDDGNDNGNQQQQRTGTRAPQNAFRMDNGDEFANPNGCFGVCPTDSSVLLGNDCVCKCQPLWTWRQDVGKCVLESGCSFSVTDDSHLPTMSFDTVVNEYLKPDHVVKKNGTAVLSSQKYYISSFSLMRFDDNSWKFPTFTLWFDLYFSTKNAQHVAIKSRARSQDLDEYYGSLVNLTISRNFRSEGCIMVKFARTLSSSGTTDFSPAPLSSLQGASGTGIGIPTNGVTSSAINLPTTVAPTLDVGTTTSQPVRTRGSNPHHTVFPSHTPTPASGETNASLEASEMTGTGNSSISLANASSASTTISQPTAPSPSSTRYRDSTVQTSHASSTQSASSTTFGSTLSGIGVRTSLPTGTSFYSVSTRTSQPTPPTMSRSLRYRTSNVQTSHASTQPAPAVTSGSTLIGKGTDISLRAGTSHIVTASIMSQKGRTGEFTTELFGGSKSPSTDSTTSFYKASTQAVQQETALSDSGIAATLPVHTVTGWITPDISPSDNKGRSEDKKKDVALLVGAVVSAAAFLFGIVVVVIVCAKTMCTNRKGRIRDENAGGHVLTNSMQRISLSSRPNYMAANNISAPWYGTLPSHGQPLFQMSGGMDATSEETVSTRVGSFQGGEYEEPVFRSYPGSDESSPVYEPLRIESSEPHDYESPQTTSTYSNTV